MNIRPSLEEVRAIVETGVYKVLPLSCELLSDLCTPIQALKKLKNVSTHCYILESVDGREKWAGVDLRAFVTNENGAFGTVRMPADDDRRAVLALAEAGYLIKRTTVLAVEVRNAAGAWPVFWTPSRRPT